MSNCGAGQGGAGEPLGSQGTEEVRDDFSGALGCWRDQRQMCLFHILIAVVSCWCFRCLNHPSHPIPAVPLCHQCHPWCHCSEHLFISPKKGNKQGTFKNPKCHIPAEAGQEDTLHPCAIGNFLGHVWEDTKCTTVVMSGVLGYPSGTARTLGEDGQKMGHVPVALPGPWEGMDNTGHVPVALPGPWEGQTGH